MLSDKLENAGCYAALPAVCAALEVLKAYVPAQFTPGRLELDGDGMSLMQLEYETKPRAGALMEAHRQYIDVMYMLQGEETICFKPTDALKAVTRPYVAAEDALLAQVDADVSTLRLQEGRFAVFFPQDAHCPGCVADRPQTVRRLVVKVPIDPHSA